ncbi:MAG TPA: DUF2177 family protein [Caulobacteraceae bacterium]|nr:DUF2177 family protein [Caulobacteraceae bacterium]
MTRLLIAYATMVALFPALDFAWFAIVARGAYQAEIGSLLNPTLQLAPAVGFYALYASGVLVFVVRPGLDRGDWRRAALAAAFFGLVAYGTFDLTCLALIKGFTLPAAALDMAWGAIATMAAASAAGFAAARL